MYSSTFTIVSRYSRKILLGGNVFHMCKTCNYGSSSGPEFSEALQSKFLKKKQIALMKVGQPTHETHPHLVGKGQVTFGITLDEYAERRYRLMECLRMEARENHIVILPATPRRYMVDRIPYIYRQDTDLLYMSGCLEADCILILHTLPGRSQVHKSVMFTPEFDPSQELWDGPKTGCDASCKVWGVDEGLTLSELPHYLEKLEHDLNSPKVWYHYSSPPNAEIHKKLEPFLLEGRQRKLESPKKHIHSLRLIKSSAEVELMRETCSISAKSILSTIRSCVLPTSEHKLYALVDYYCRMRGADRLAYPPVVAGGNRANIIHYISNNQILKDGEMVLMDAGSDFRGYSGDVTRTWPVSGTFTGPQREIYEVVLDVQQTVIAACAQRPTMDHLFSVMCYRLGKCLQELCILPKDYNDSQVLRAAYGFCPHHVSHYLGMDVHDTALVSKHLPLQPNMIITVEPGIYINERNSSVPSCYTGLAVRLEDDILVTESGVEVLTESCPKLPDEIECLVGTDVKSH